MTNTELDSHVPSVVVPESTFPTSNKPGKLDVQLATVLLPAPAFPRKTFEVSFPLHEFVMIPFSEFITTNHCCLSMQTHSCLRAQLCSRNCFLYFPQIFQKRGQNHPWKLV